MRTVCPVLSDGSDHSGILNDNPYPVMRRERTDILEKRGDSEEERKRGMQHIRPPYESPVY